MLIFGLGLFAATALGGAVQTCIVSFSRSVQFSPCYKCLSAKVLMFAFFEWGGVFLNGGVKGIKKIVQRHPPPPISPLLHVRLLPVELLKPYGEAVGVLMVFSMREL